MAAPQFILALHLGKTVAAKKRCRVLYSYQPKHEDELELKVDDVVDFESEVEDGWWKGKLVSYLKKGQPRSLYFYLRSFQTAHFANQFQLNCIH